MNELLAYLIFPYDSVLYVLLCILAVVLIIYFVRRT